MISTTIKEYKDSLITVEQAGFATPDDLKFLSENIESVQANWKKNQVFRTQTEMNVSVLDNLHYPTVSSKYWQSVREQASMYSELVCGSFAYRRNEIEIKKLERDISLYTKHDKLELDMLKIDLEEKLYTRLNSELQLNDRIREIRMWQEKLDELSAMADFDTENVNTHQLVSYALRFQNQMELLQQNASGSSQSEIDNLVGQFQTVRTQLEAAGLMSVAHPDFVANSKLNKPERAAISLEAKQDQLKANPAGLRLVSESRNKEA